MGVVQCEVQWQQGARGTIFQDLAGNDKMDCVCRVLGVRCTRAVCVVCCCLCMLLLLSGSP